MIAVGNHALTFLARYPIRPSHQSCQSPSSQVLWHCTHIFQFGLGKESLVRFNNRRIQEKIKVNALWPYTSKDSKDYIWSGKDILTERRIAKKGTEWNMGYTIYGDKVSFISSTKEVFGFIIQSKDFAELMKVQFDVLWGSGKKKA